VIRVRPARPDDAAALARIYAPHVDGSTVSFEETAPSADVLAARMAGAGPFHPWLIAEEAGAVVAYAYASPFRGRAAYRWAAETTVYVAGERAGRGVGRHVYGALLDLLAAQGFTEALGVIALPNPASVRLHERLGFVAVGVNPRVGWKAGRWVDVGVWQRALAAAGPPAPLRPWSDALTASGARAPMLCRAHDRAGKDRRQERTGAAIAHPSTRP
jgi:L-amino acid N-acyltransferase YncA